MPAAEVSIRHPGPAAEGDSAGPAVGAVVVTAHPVQAAAEEDLAGPVVGAGAAAGLPAVAVAAVADRLQEEDNSSIINKSPG